MTASRRTVAAVTLLASAATLAACSDPEAKARQALAAEYVRELDGGAEGKWHVREVLTLREDGNWVRTMFLESAARGEERPASDSGTYRITGVTINLRSLVQPGGLPVRFIVSGDTLYGANAARIHAETGLDVGEAIFVRSR